MQKHSDYSKKILKILAENRAVSVPELATKMAQEGEKMPAKERYAINRALRNLQESGLAEGLSSDREEYARITPAGRRKAISHKLEARSSLVPNWDGKWRIVLLDLPESRKSERESLRYLLKKAGFVCLKNSAWISPFPFEHLFMNIKKDFGLTTEMMVLVTDYLDTETKTALFKLFWGNKPSDITGF